MIGSSDSLRKRRSIIVVTCFALMCSTASADIAINLTAPTGRGDRDAPSPTLADFQAFAGTQLAGATTVFNADPNVIGGGVGGAWNFFNTTQTIGGIGVQTIGDGNSFAAGNDDVLTGRP